MEIVIGPAVLRLLQGDITRVAADAIVNAANSGLRGGGGVDGAIHRAGGASIMAELDGIRRVHGGCRTGSAVVTAAGLLPARFVFHAVGPIYRPGDAGQERLLASCYTVCLRLAVERGLSSITFPSISTGAYGYPLDEAAPVAIGAVADFLASGEHSIRQAAFVLFDRTAFDAYRTALGARRGENLREPTE